ncbi:AbiJ-NTD4 domain-containing protein [Flavonifractor porci]|uniref:AbiJ-NTD4 domain-containing protein n=1 Tax=Flavonifractor porci TaxID=3133422 RepID=UPI00309C55EB
MVFSQRNAYVEKTIRLETVDRKLKQRIISAFLKHEFNSYESSDWSYYGDEIHDLIIKIGAPNQFSSLETVKQQNIINLQNYLMESSEWYKIFDFIEYYLECVSTTKVDEVTSVINRILEEESYGYRVLDKQVIPITNVQELSTIHEAHSTLFDSVNKHFSKALDLYADRTEPDYENSIKESISAVEAMCCIITGETGSQATLGKTIKKLKDKGIHIHPAMESAFSSLYGYTSDEDGIRHGSIGFTNAPAEDAKYMLVSCSAFVNYLIEKWSKVSD